MKLKKRFTTTMELMNTNMKTCPICKKEVANDAKVCPNCGHTLIKEKKLEMILKRHHASYLLDILIMVLPLSLIALMVIKKYLLAISIPIALICLIWGYLSIKKKKQNNKILKDLIYLNKENNEITVFTIDNREHTYPIDLVKKITKEVLITQRVFITLKEANPDHITYHTYKLDLGYAKNEDVKEAKKKLNNVEVEITVE